MPVILNKKFKYDGGINKEAAEAMKILYKTQFFPQKGDHILVEGWESMEILSRDISLDPAFPLILFRLDWTDWSQGDENIFYEYYELEEIYTFQRKILGL